MNQKKSNPVVDAILTVVLALLLICAGIYFLAMMIAALWNFVMPVLGLPMISPLHALALYFLYKVFSSEHKQKQNINLTANIAPDKKENGQ